MASSKTLLPSNLPSIPIKLNTTNYYLWRNVMVPLLKAYELLGYDSGNISGASRQNFSVEVNAKDYGFEPSTDKSVSKNIDLGLAALRGEKGPAYDRIILWSTPYWAVTGQKMSLQLDRLLIVAEP